VTRSAHLIINPRSGKGKVARNIEHLFRMLDLNKVEYTPHYTEGCGHAIDLIRGFDRTDHMIVAVGGDGTVNEVVNGAEGRDVSLGVIPFGTGNDFSRLLGIRNPAAGVAALATAQTRTLDTGEIDIVTSDGSNIHRRFINTMGIGFDAAVAYRVSSVSHGTGIVPYLLAVFHELRRFVPVSARIDYNGEIRETSLFLASVGNGTTSGGGFILSPNALADDGLLDLCFVRSVRTTRVLTLLPRTFNGSHVGQPEVTYLRSRQYRIVLSDSLPVHADGELLASNAVEITVKVDPGSARVIVPCIKR
jgi:diacylglycerol kinase (ATP)